MLVSASKNEDDIENSATNSGGNSMENVGNSILVKIEEDEYSKVNVIKKQMSRHQAFLQSENSHA